MTTLCIEDCVLDMSERSEFKVRRAIRMRASIWGVTGNDVRVAERCSMNALRYGESEAAAIDKGYRALAHARRTQRLPGGAA